MNVQNKDDRCFEWAILPALRPVEYAYNNYRTSKYKVHLGELNFDGIDFPVKVTDLLKFERQNPD